MVLHPHQALPAGSVLRVHDDNPTNWGLELPSLIGKHTIGVAYNAIFLQDWRSHPKVKIFQPIMPFKLIKDWTIKPSVIPVIPALVKDQLF